MSQLFMRIPE